MGRFATTVPFYARYREPYPPEFFAAAASRLKFSGSERLVDLGCGPAQLALGFASFVGSCTGIDPEPAMVDAARAQAAQAGVNLNLIPARVEELPDSVGRFDVVTIGRALHWMEPIATLRVLDWLVAESGWILTCSASPVAAPANPWLEPYNAVKAKWSKPAGEERYSKDAEQRFAGSRFNFVERIAVRFSHQVTIDDLIGRMLSRSTNSPAVLGEQVAEFTQATRQVLRPFATDGVLPETIEAVARVFRAAGAYQQP
jgi:SAM-dependent methyltransferase